MIIVVARQNPYLQRINQELVRRLMVQQIMHQLITQLFLAAVFRNFHQQPFSPQQRSFQPRETTGDRFTDDVARYNDDVRGHARATNQDGGDFLRAIIAKQDSSFRAKVAEADPEIFASSGLPALAVDQLIASRNPLTRFNTPKFAHAHLRELEELRKNPSNKHLKDDIATALSREAAFIAAVQNAS